MSDLTERLRKYAPAATKPTVADIMDKAADRLEAMEGIILECLPYVQFLVPEAGGSKAVDLIARIDTLLNNQKEA